MYGSFEDFARYANDREMDSFGTQEFFDYHNEKRMAASGGGVVESLAELGADNPVLQGLADAVGKIAEYLNSVGRPVATPPLPAYAHPSPQDTTGVNPWGKEQFWGGTPFSNEGGINETRYPSLRMDGGYEPGGVQRIPDATLTPDVGPLNLQMLPTPSAPADGVPPDLAPLLEQNMGPVGEGVKVAAADTGTMSDAVVDSAQKPVLSDSTLASVNKLIANVPDAPDAARAGDPTNTREAYRLALGDGLIAIGMDDRTARRLANNLIGTEESLGLGHFEPVSVFTEGRQSVARGIQTGDNQEIAFGVVDMLTAGIPFYGKTAAKVAKSLINDIGERFGKRTDVYHGPRVEYGTPQISELAKYKGADAQGFGFYLTTDPVTALGHSHTFNIKQSSMLNRAIPTLLNRAAPLDQQGKGVLEKLERGLKKVPADHPFAIALNAVKSGDGYNSVRGSQFYNKLSEEFGKQVPGNAGDKRRAGQELASTYLGSLGIPGASEGGGKMFIVWDQKLLDKMKWGKTQPDIDKALITPGGLARPGYNKPAGEAAATKDKERK